MYEHMKRPQAARVVTPSSLDDLDSLDDQLACLRDVCAPADNVAPLALAQWNGEERTRKKERTCEKSIKKAMKSHGAEADGSASGQQLEGADNSVAVEQ